MKSSKLSSTAQIIRPRSAATHGTSNSREYYKSLCNKLKIQTYPAILEGYSLISLNFNQIELNIDEITSETISILPKLLAKVSLISFKLWSIHFEKTEYTRLGIRKSRIRKDAKFNSDSAVLLSRLFYNLSTPLKTSSIQSCCLFGLRLSSKTWSRLSSSFSSMMTETLVLSYCEISDKDLQVICKNLGLMKRLKVLDLSHNKISDGYTLGRIISKQGERRDTLKWEGGLRGSVADFPAGLDEIYLAFNSIADHGWSKLMTFIASDNWLRLVDCKSNLISLESVKTTIAALEINKALLVLDLRGNKEFDSGYVKVLEVVDKNFELLKESSPEYEKYLNIFERICNEEDLPEVVQIRAIKKLVKKKQCDDEYEDKRSSSVYLDRISQECEKLKEENAKLRKKMAFYDDIL
jgi:Leucine-rich repeat (LRR) protein